MEAIRKRTWLFKNLANIITGIGFVFLIFLLVTICVSPRNLFLIAVLTAIIGITDFFDGKVARRLQIISNFGRAFDRLRDKLFIGSALIFLAWIYPDGAILPPATAMATEVLTLANLLTEATLLTLWFVSVLKGFDSGSQNAGKIKMFCQFTAVIVWLVSLAADHYYEYTLFQKTIYFVDFALALSIFFGAQSVNGYCRRYFSQKSSPW